jgi:hypothetical protein
LSALLKPSTPLPRVNNLALHYARKRNGDCFGRANYEGVLY